MAEEQTAAPQKTPPSNGWQVLINQIRQWPLSRKIALGVVTAISLSLFAFIIIEARTADYQLLYGNLSQSDAASIVDWLKSKNIPYQIKDNGHSILVPAASLHETRLSLASAGLPQGSGVGYEIFDKQSFALTDFVQKVNYTRALQGELARTIASLGPVESARVHLALPEKRLFKNQQKPATASVIIRLKPGRRLDESQVQGIVHLVSSAVEGLAPEHVTVINQNGNVLTRTTEDGLGGNISPDMLDYQLQVERHLEERAQALLDKALGANKSMVRVTAQLDFARFEKTEEFYDPDEPVIRSEQVSEEKTGSEIVGGVPGVQSNLQGNTNQAAGSTPPSSRTKRTTNYEISKVVSKTVNPVGTIKKISVAVLVADRVVPGKGKKPAKMVPRSKEELNSLKNMIASALGIDKARGDKIEVTSMPFTKTGQSKEGEGVTGISVYEYMPLVRYGLLLVAGLLIYLLMIRPLIKTLREDVTQHFKTVQELEAEQQRAKEARREQEQRAMAQDPLLRIRKDIEENPVFAAHVLKNWIHEKG